MIGMCASPTVNPSKIFVTIRPQLSDLPYRQSENISTDIGRDNMAL